MCKDTRLRWTSSGIDHRSAVILPDHGNQEEMRKEFWRDAAVATELAPINGWATAHVRLKEAAPQSFAQQITWQLCHDSVLLSILFFDGYREGN